MADIIVAYAKIKLAKREYFDAGSTKEVFGLDKM